jgi:hypothetical protein
MHPEFTVTELIKIVKLNIYIYIYIYIYISIVYAPVDLLLGQNQLCLSFYQFNIFNLDNGWPTYDEAQIKS